MYLRELQDHLYLLHLSEFFARYCLLLAFPMWKTFIRSMNVRSTLRIKIYGVNVSLYKAPGTTLCISLVGTCGNAEEV